MPLSEKTCQRRLVALCAWARDKGSQPPDLRAAQQVLRGHQRLTGGTAPARAAPITLPVLRALVAQAQLGEGPRPSLRSLRDTALLLAGFGLAARRSELVALNVEHVTFTVQGAAVRLHRRKTHDVAVTMPLPHAIDPLVCPVRALSALQAELTARGLGAGPIFRRVSRTDVSGDRLHASSVTVIVAGLAEATGLPVPAGYESWSAHGLRRGLASEARKAGADRWAIARAGSWSASSKSLETYVDDLQVWEQSALRGLL
jgi:integrase